jgi:hypothetical protein
MASCSSWRHEDVPPEGGLDGVEETNNIRVGRIKLVPRTERLKSQEQEVPKTNKLVKLNC